MATCPVVWADSFMTYASADVGKWYTLSGSPLINNSNGRGGRGSYSNTAGGAAQATMSLGASYDTILMSAALDPTGLGGTGSQVFIIGGASGAPNLQLKNGGTTLQVVNAAFSVVATTTQALPLNSWSHVAARFYLNGSSGTVDVWLNETLILSLTGVNTGSAVTSATISANNLLLLSDYIIQASNTSTDTPVGDRAVTAMMPNGAGFYTGYSVTGAATNWQAVSEVPPNGDTSYVYSSTATTKDSYTIASLPAATASVDAVILKRIAEKTDAGSRAEASLVRISGTDYIGSGQNLSTSYIGYYHAYDVSPATSAAWGVAEVNGMEIGHEVST